MQEVDAQILCDFVISYIFTTAIDPQSNGPDFSHVEYFFIAHWAKCKKMKTEADIIG